MIHSNIYISSLATKRFVRALVTTCPILTLNFCWMPSLIIYMLIHSGVVFTQIQVELLDCDTSRFLVRFQIVTCDWPYIGFVRSVDSNRVIRRTCLKKKTRYVDENRTWMLTLLVFGLYVPWPKSLNTDIIDLDDATVNRWWEGWRTSDWEGLAGSG